MHQQNKSVKQLSSPFQEKRRNVFIKSAGFTLVEVLVGVTLLGFILLLAFSSLHTAGRSWNAADTKVTRTDELRLASQFIRQRLAQTVPLIWINKDKRRIAFQGTDDEIHFVAPLPAHRGGGGLYLLTLKTIAEEGQQNLVLYTRLALPDRQTFDLNSRGKHETTVVAENIGRIAFSYFGSTGPDETPQWQDRWDAEEQLPNMVRVRLTPADPQTGWPELSITLQPRVVNGQPQFQQFAGNEADAL